MGENQIRKAAEQAGAEAMQMRFVALGDLAVAADKAAGNDDLVADAEVRAAEMIAAAKAEAEKRTKDWREKWLAARAAGWRSDELQAAPINQSSPPAAAKVRKPRAKKQQDQRVSAGHGDGLSAGLVASGAELEAAQPSSEA